MTADTPAAAPITAEKVLEIAQKCGATVYRNRASPHTPAVAFGDESWARFCAALSAPVAAPPAASGVAWVERAMELAEELETAAILYGASEPESDEERDCRERRRAARDSMRTHLSTALTGAAKD